MPVQSKTRIHSGHGFVKSIQAAIRTVRVSLETLNRIEFDAPWQHKPCRDC